MNVRARHGAHYFITFIDDFTKYSDIYLISHNLKHRNASKDIVDWLRIN